MSVYVDELVDWGVTYGRAGPEWCHMTADTLDELHEFAAAIGLKRQWFQNHPRHPHYDLTRNKRALAVRLGAVEETSREMVHRQMESR